MKLVLVNFILKLWSVNYICNSPFRRQPHPGPREALPRPVHALPEHDPDALEVGRREDADPVADDPAGEPRSGTGHGGHPTVPLRTGPRQAAAHLGILGKRLTSPKSGKITHLLNLVLKLKTVHGGRGRPGDAGMGRFVLVKCVELGDFLRMYVSTQIDCGK